MTTKLEREIAEHEIEHPRFVETLGILRERVDDAIAGREPRITLLVGPSRIGKTRLVEALERSYLERTENGRRIIPFAVGNVGSSTSPRDLPRVPLGALGVPIPPNVRSMSELSALMFEQIELGGTKAMAFDEASNTLSAGASVKPAAVAQWFKDTQTKANLAQLLIGVPRLLRLKDTTEEFRNRCYKEIVWLPYDIGKNEQRDLYATAVNTFLKTFERHGWEFQAPPEVIVLHCYAHSPGLIGKLRDLMMVMATKLPKDGRQIITLDDFRRVACTLESAGPPESKPFEGDALDLVTLHQAYLYVLKKNDL